MVKETVKKFKRGQEIFNVFKDSTTNLLTIRKATYECYEDGYHEINGPGGLSACALNRSVFDTEKEAIDFIAKRKAE